jgi:hypothetical protein
MRDRGDTLLFSVSAKRQLSWSSFTAALDAVFMPDERLGLDMKDVRSGVAALGDALAHWDVVPSGNTARVVISPPVLAVLPRPGLPTAVLCGSRSPDTVPALTAVCRDVRASVRTTPQGQLHMYAPTLIEVTANSYDTLAAVADKLNIRCDPQPPAWGLAVACGSLGDYLASLPWTTGTDLNWIRRDFDAQSLRLSPTRGGATGTGLRLSAYEHPDGWAREDRLWRGNESATVDRNWGRYAVLADRGIQVCRYDHAQGTFTVPRQAPLPKIAARTLGLCSGRPPAIERGKSAWYHAYMAVPRGIADVLGRKLGQHCVASTDSSEDETT